MDYTYSHDGSPPSNGEADSARSHRFNIAGQACETCRRRKSRCDEGRPRCGFCVRLDVPCIYRERRATKTDQTESKVLSSVRRIDEKLDSILATNNHTVRTMQRPGTQAAVLEQWIANASLDSSLLQGDGKLRGALSVFRQPSIQRLLESAGGRTASDLEEIIRQGSGWLISQEFHSHANPLPYDSLSPSSSLHVVIGNEEQVRIVFSDLNGVLMEAYTDAYFTSFNKTYPVLDCNDFKEHILPSVRSYGFADGNTASLIALLVFALGKMSVEGLSGKPISDGSGIRGGTVQRPPGLEIFNEARRRVGFVLSSCSLENSQAMLLMAIYYEASSKHIDFWRTALTAAGAIKALLRTTKEWGSYRGDMLRRLYWICLVIESWYYFDLNLPGSDISAFEESVALPVFSGQEAVGDLQYQYNLLAMVSLRRLIHHVFENLNGPTETVTRGGDEIQGGLIIGQLSLQLDSWREILPDNLQWDDAARMVFKTQPSSPHSDVVSAQLRCRYYYARFMIFRPYIWKALEYPALQLSPEDIDRFTVAVDSMLQWPIACSPQREKKRLIPNIFAWTQSFLMFLLILRAIREDPRLVEICIERIGSPRMDESVELMLEWMNDMRQVDGVPGWAWSTLKTLYQLPE